MWPSPVHKLVSLLKELGLIAVSTGLIGYGLFLLIFYLIFSSVLVASTLAFPIGLAVGFLGWYLDIKWGTTAELIAARYEEELKRAQKLLERGASCQVAVGLAIKANIRYARGLASDADDHLRKVEELQLWILENALSRIAGEVAPEDYKRLDFWLQWINKIESSVYLKIGNPGFLKRLWHLRVSSKLSDQLGEQELQWYRKERNPMIDQRRLLPPEQQRTNEISFDDLRQRRQQNEEESR
jgi:hypothetical protein